MSFDWFSRQEIFQKAKKRYSTENLLNIIPKTKSKLFNTKKKHYGINEFCFYSL